MKNKKQKNYLIFMALFLAITMAITSSITLAYFGASAKGSTVIKLANGVDVDSSITLTSQDLFVVPSQIVDIDATAKVKTIGSGTVTDGLLRAKVNVNNTSSSSATIAVVPESEVNGKTYYWKKHSDNYYYLMQNDSTDAGNLLATIVPTAEGNPVEMKISFHVPSSLSNTNAGDTYSVSVIFTVIQAKIFDNSGASAVANTIRNTFQVFNHVEGLGITAKSIERISGNSIQSATPTPDKPVEIQSVGDRTRNLFDKNTIIQGYIRSDGLVETVDWYYCTDFIEISGDSLIYQEACETSSTARFWAFYDQNKNLISSERQMTNDEGNLYYILNIPSNAKYFRCNVSPSNLDIAMIYLGDSATSYEPYGYKIPVSVGEYTYNIYLDEPLRKVGEYADYIDFTTGQIVRQVKELELTSASFVYNYRSTKGVGFSGNENILDSSYNKIAGISNREDEVGKTNEETGCYMWLGAGNNCVYWCGILDYLELTTLEEFNKWLSAHPTYVYYVSESPIIENIDLSHIPNGTETIYSVNTDVRPTIVYG